MSIAPSSSTATPSRHRFTPSGRPVLDLIEGGLAQHPLRGRHALVVGINYAPEPTGIAPYTTGMAEHLATHADSVTVLTGVPHYPSWEVPAHYRTALRWKEEVSLSPGSDLLVHRLRHTVPRRMNALSRATYEATFLAHASVAPVRQRPDVVIAVTPSLGAAVAAVPITRRHGAKLVVVVQDLMGKACSQSGISGGCGPVTKATEAMERYALTRADMVLVVSESFRAPVRAYGVADDKIALLPNWTHIASVDVPHADARDKLGWPVEPFTVVHTGNMGFKQDLGNMVEAARLLEHDPSIGFVLVGDGSQRQAVADQAAGLANVTFVDPLDDEKYPLSLAAADLLVVNERPGVAEMSLPSKLTSYLSTGRAVLAAVEGGGATHRELNRTGGAALVISPGDPRAFADGVRDLQLDPLRCTRMGRMGRSYADATLGKAAAMTRLDDVIRHTLDT